MSLVNQLIQDFAVTFTFNGFAVAMLGTAIILVSLMASKLYLMGGKK
jgi:hypothetical protein